jgi:hypothetical protein
MINKAEQHQQLPIGASKLPPGPRMPDGSRGFTMGRGKPQAALPVPCAVGEAKCWEACAYCCHCVCISLVAWGFLCEDLFPDGCVRYCLDRVSVLCTSEQVTISLSLTDWALSGEGYHRGAKASSIFRSGPHPQRWSVSCSL